MIYTTVLPMSLLCLDLKLDEALVVLAGVVGQELVQVVHVLLSGVYI